MRITTIAAWCAGVWLLIGGTASADVQLSIANGHVSLTAKDATVGQILVEWARVGQTHIVNLDRIQGGPITIELQGVPEAQALDTILRAVSGYMAAPRQTPIANASIFDRIVVMPTSVAPPPVRAAAPAPPVFPQPQFGQPAPFQPQPASADEDSEPSPQRPPFNAFQPPQVINQPLPPNSAVGPAQGPLVLPQTGPANAASPAVPIGVPTPGMVVQPPVQQPQGQPVIPGQPRRPGGPGGPDNR